ncbi:MAG: hypothetical protein HYR58_08275 [Acidobacteria bacterium]|nr:hypothetical protein [Acidobacteriota bacterium]MBI3484965.1 hypothetical protein [Acidobacteriota bacterium]
MKLKTLGLFAILVVALIAAYPFEVTVAPDWTVKVVDEVGRPLVKVTVTETTRYYPFQLSPNEERQVTDASGLAHFSRRTLRLSRAARTFACLKRIIAEGIKFGCGPEATIWAEKVGYGPISYDTDTGWDGRVDPRSSHIVLQQCAKGKTGNYCRDEVQ